VFDLFRFVVDVRLLSRCGIFCGACFVYRAERDGGALLDEMAKRFGVPKEKIRCNGCSSPFEEQWGNCQKCNFKACQMRKSIKNCAQCEAATCPDYGYLTRFTAYRHEDIREGLRRIEVGKGEEWMLEQEKRWTCPHCNSPIMWYDSVCRECDWKVREKPISIDGYSEK